jgi:hypothetical protein
MKAGEYNDGVRVQMEVERGEKDWVWRVSVKVLREARACE